MLLDEQLKPLINKYASFNKQTNSYEGVLTEADKIRLDSEFTSFINSWLIQDGIEEQSIKKNYKLLSLKFHPDKIFAFSPERKWLTSILSENQNDGLCFKTITFCYNKLLNPQDYTKSDEKQRPVTREDLRKWLMEQQANASNYTQRMLYKRLLGLFNAGMSYSDTVTEINIKSIRRLILYLPLFLGGIGTVLCAKELMAIYSVSLLLLKGGNYLQQFESKELEMLGSALKDMSSLTVASSTTIIALIMEMIFWVSQKGYVHGVGAAAKIFKPLLGCRSSNNAESSDSKAGAFAKESVHIHTFAFNTPEMQLIAASLISYLEVNSAQWFRSYRIGSYKHTEIWGVLNALNQIDKLVISTEDKVKNSAEILSAIKTNKKVYVDGSSAQRAIDNALTMLDILGQPDVAERFS